MRLIRRTLKERAVGKLCSLRAITVVTSTVNERSFRDYIQRLQRHGAVVSKRANVAEHGTCDRYSSEVSAEHEASRFASGLRDLERRAVFNAAG